jgi:hypothetical protein
MCCGNVRISTVYGGTWPAAIWKAFMLEATRYMPIKGFAEAPDVEYVTMRVDATQGCLANPFTLPQNIDIFEYLAGTEPTLAVCTEPSEYQLLTVPSVIGLQREAAVSTLQAAGFEVAVELVPSEQLEGTVIGQDPAAGQRLIQTGTVTITVVRGEPEPSPPPVVLVTVPDVVGMSEGAATAALRGAGFDVSVSAEQECDPLDPACDYRQGVVWTQTPSGDTEAPPGSTVTIVVNP